MKSSTTDFAYWRGGMLRASGSTPANGYNFADRFPRIVEAIAGLPVRCFIDGEAIFVDENGLSVFDLIRYRQHDSAAVLCAFDLIELGDAASPSPTFTRGKAEFHFL